MKETICPRCQSGDFVKSGIVKNRQRYKCKNCQYNFTVAKLGKEIDSYFVVKAMQLYIEGISYREIERILGVSHVSVMNWVKKYKIKAPKITEYKPSYKVLTHQELLSFFSEDKHLNSKGFLITELGDKYMMIRWDRFRE